MQREMAGPPAITIVSEALGDLEGADHLGRFEWRCFDRGVVARAERLASAARDVAENGSGVERVDHLGVAVRGLSLWC